MKHFTSKTQKLGELGENTACNYLIKHGYSLLERNYTKKYGEVDIIAQKNGILHFIEVKTVSCEIDGDNVIHETLIKPEDNMHPVKIRRLHNTIQAYLLERGIDDTTIWQLDLACIYFDIGKKKAKVSLMENIIS